MKSELRIMAEERVTKIDVFEDLLETLNNRITDYGEIVIDCTKEEFNDMNWSEQREHYLRTSEGLLCTRPRYDEDTDDTWEKAQNFRYEKAVEAFKIVRTALEKWVEK